MGMPYERETRSPTLMIVMLLIIVLAIGAFLMLRPRGSGVSNQTSPATPASSR